MSLTSTIATLVLRSSRPLSAAEIVSGCEDYSIGSVHSAISKMTTAGTLLLDRSAGNPPVYRVRDERRLQMLAGGKTLVRLELDGELPPPSERRPQAGQPGQVRQHFDFGPLLDAWGRLPGACD